MEALNQTLQKALADKRVSLINELIIVTDRLDYGSIDQVFPLFAEQQFFLDELQSEKICDADVLEVGLGSGVLTLGAIRAGARHVTALEINPRARSFAGFNILLNHAEDRVTVLTGNDDIFSPIADRRFDYIISNPPFEPTPPEMAYFYHSAAGPYGLDFMAKLFQGIDAHLSASGHAQIVTAAPGDASGPSLLLDLIERRLPGTTTLRVNPFAMTFDTIMDRLAQKPLSDAARVEALRQRARRDGITHMHLCVLHNQRGPDRVHVEPSRTVYEHYWDIPARELA